MQTAEELCHVFSRVLKSSPGAPGLLLLPVLLGERSALLGSVYCTVDFPLQPFLYSHCKVMQNHLGQTSESSAPVATSKELGAHVAGGGTWGHPVRALRGTRHPGWGCHLPNLWGGVLPPPGSPASLWDSLRLGCPAAK